MIRAYPESNSGYIGKFPQIPRLRPSSWRNGTLVNKKLLHKDGNQSVCLRDQDLVEVLPASKVGQAAAIAFLFHAPLSAAPPPTKKPRLMEGPTVSDFDADQILGEATCAICQEVMHRATSVQPCMHSFCSSCLGGWLKRPGDKLPRCPVCRQAVAAVGKNHVLDSLIEKILKAHPDKMRSVAALADLDSRDPLYDNGYDLVKLRGGGGVAAGFARLTVAAAAAAEAMDAESEHSQSEFSSSEEEVFGPEHAWAEPGAVRPACRLCGVPAWRPLRSASETIANPLSATFLTKTALANNTFEQEILQEWLHTKGLSLQQAIIDLLANPNPEGVPAVRWHAPFGGPTL
eukprot:g16039.t2